MDAASYIKDEICWKCIPKGDDVSLTVTGLGTKYVYVTYRNPSIGHACVNEFYFRNKM